MFNRALKRVMLCFLLLPAFHIASAQGATQAPTDHAGWTLVWNDEFNGPNGSAPDPKHWHVIEAGNGFGNDELEYYTARSKNVVLQDGNLLITARREGWRGADGVRHYTSARLESKGLFDVQYGRVEARMKTPAGQGIWPAFWMLGSNIDAVGWPDCGEIDVMENIGREPNAIHGTLHGPGYSGAEALGKALTLPDSARVADDYHTYAVEWEPGQIRFYIDSTLYATRTAADVAGNRWVFDHPFYILLDLAVGGDWPGNPDQHTKFPARMLVDYVRVYQRTVQAPAHEASAPERANAIMPAEMITK